MPRKWPRERHQRPGAVARTYQEIRSKVQTTLTNESPSSRKGLTPLSKHPHRTIYGLFEELNQKQCEKLISLAQAVHGRELTDKEVSEILRDADNALYNGRMVTMALKGDAAYCLTDHPTAMCQFQPVVFELRGEDRDLGFREAGRYEGRRGAYIED